jgi:hypothetical protein
LPQALGEIHATAVGGQKKRRIPFSAMFGKTTVLLMDCRRFRIHIRIHLQDKKPGLKLKRKA